MAGSGITALRLAYLGWSYHGVVRQRGVPTVESALAEALAEQGITVKLRFTSRTDKGVSALDNVAFYRGPPPNASLLNARLPMDLAVWAVASSERVPKPTMRVYLYAVPFKLDRVHELLETLGPDRTGAVSARRLEVETGDNFTYIKVYGRSFGRNEVRRLVGRLIELSTGRRMGLAPPEGLILLRTVTDLEWKEISRRKLFLMRKIIERSIWRLEAMRVLHRTLGATSL